MTVEEVVLLLTLLVAVFSIGYKVGKDINKKH